MLCLRLLLLEIIYFKEQSQIEGLEVQQSNKDNPTCLLVQLFLKHQHHSLLEAILLPQINILSESLQLTAL